MAAEAGGGPPILRRLLEAAGYRLEDRPVGLLALRPSDRRAVVLVDGLRSPAEAEEELPKGWIHRTLVYAEEPGPLARELASGRGMEVLTPSSIGPALGELLLPGPGRLPPGAAMVPTDALEAPAQVFPEGERVLRPRLTRVDAEAVAGIESPRCTLRLVPFYVAPYRVRVPTPQGAPGPTGDHLVAVNGLTGRVEVWEPNERELSPDPYEAPRYAPVLTDGAAAAAAAIALRKRHTVSVDHTEQHGGAIVIERRRVPPGPGDLRIGTVVLVHAPFWYVEGPDGRVIVDAISGARSDPGEPEPPAR